MSLSIFIFYKNFNFVKSSLFLKRKGINHIIFHNFFSKRPIMLLSSVVKIIEEVVPRKLSEKWDNTGLLVDPSRDLKVSTIFFTNDLTESVMEEAISIKANLIISYHPPIFTSIKSFSSQRWKDRIVMKCIQNSIAIYSPHTACDAVVNGVNDWLLNCFDVKDIKPITPSAAETDIIECFALKDFDLNETLCSYSNFKVLHKSLFEDKVHLEVLVETDIVSQVCQILSACSNILAVSVKNCKKLHHLPVSGMGRIGNLEKTSSLGDCISRIKSYLNLNHIRVAIATNCTIDSEIHSIAVCAGSGASLLKGVPADLFVTGEMSHHDMLDCIHNKTNVILCEHSNSERGYLEHFVKKLQNRLKDVNMVVSKNDRDPVSIV